MNYRAILIATAQTLGLFVAGLLHPIGQLLTLFTAVPLIVIYVREGRNNGLAALGGWHTSAVLLLSFGLMAVGAGEGMRRGMRPEQTALLGGLMPVIVVGAALSFYLVKAGKNPVPEIESYLRESIAAAVKTYNDMGLAETATQITSYAETIVHYGVRLIPGITIATSVLQAASSFGIARFFIARKQGTAPALQQARLSEWHAPDTWIWGLITALALVVVPQDAAKVIGWNLSILFGIVYLAQGTAIVDFFLSKTTNRNFLRGLTIALALIFAPAILFVMVLGVMDIWSDFRKVRTPVLKS